jgi:hypothetical protein
MPKYLVKSKKGNWYETNKKPKGKNRQYMEITPFWNTRITKIR